MSFSLGNTNIGDIYYGATKITNAYLGSTHVYQSLKPITLTLCASNGGTLTADTITGFPGDTIELAPTYDTYWRLSGYDVYGDGSISDNTYTFGSDDEQIVSAYFKPNAFTATGSFNFGTLSHSYGNGGVKTADRVGNAIVNGFTGGRPSNWPANGAAWNVTDASAYSVKSITTWSYQLVNKGRFAFTGTIRIGNTSKASVSKDTGFGSMKKTWTAACNMSPNSTQGLLNAYGKISGNTMNNEYRIWLSTNSWSATGYAP